MLSAPFTCGAVARDLAEAAAIPIYRNMFDVTTIDVNNCNIIPGLQDCVDGRIMTQIMWCEKLNLLINLMV